MGAPQKGRADFFAPGDWNMACSMCGRKRKFSTLVKNWQGLYRCPEHNEARHPQDFARGIKDDPGVPVAQVETDKFTIFCTYNGISAIPGYAVPGCMIPGRAVVDRSQVPAPGTDFSSTNVTWDTTGTTLDNQT